uniref:D-3-phosphoglycerate dehydrogenase n=1 Tax=Coccolithus braarudii TaxID=221442 RepID=A0A7S0L5D1_9EUKA
MIGEYDGLIVRSGTTVTADIIESASKMQCIGRAGTGVDNIDCTAATRKGIVVMNTPGGNTVSAAEHTCALIASLARNVAQGDMSMKAGKWDRKKYMGVELDGKTLGVLGLGRVGREVVSRMQAYNMKVVGYDPLFPAEAARKLDIEPVSAAEAMARADFLTIHVPLLEETKNMINTKTIATMKPGVRIVNCARGGIIDEAALLEGLNSGHVAGAALDVFESEPPADHEWALIKHPKMIATPHLGASTEEAQSKVAQEIARSMVSAFAEQPVAGVVNAPDLTLAQKPELKPWTTLAESMGSLAAQVLDGQVRKVKVEVTGAVSKAGSLCLASSLVGIFGKVTGESVNLISAPTFASEREIEVTHEVSTEESVYSSLLKITVETAKGTKVIAGTVFGPTQLRIVQFEDKYIEFTPSGYLFIYKSIDKPGVLSRVSGFLGEARVNIKSAAVSTASDGSKEIVNVFSVDQRLEPGLCKKAYDLPDVSEVKAVYI